MTRMIETDEAGRLVLPEELLGEIKPHTKYIVEANNDGLIIYPAELILTKKRTKVTHQQWETQWKELQTRMSEIWPANTSAADVISKMRR